MIAPVTKQPKLIRPATTQFNWFQMVRELPDHLNLSALEEHLASPIPEAGRDPPFLAPAPKSLSANRQFFRYFGVRVVLFAIDLDRHVTILFTMLRLVTACPQG
jgi:hypothetical protein